jgi:hypothetical protein
LPAVKFPIVVLARVEEPEIAKFVPIIVVTDKIANGIIGKKVTKLLVKLCCKSFVV